MSFIKHLLNEQRKALQQRVVRRTKSLDDAAAALAELDSEITKHEQSQKR